MPAEPPAVDAASFQTAVAVLSCDNDSYRRGLYRVTDLRVPAFGPESRRFPAPRAGAEPKLPDHVLIDSAAFLLLDGRCAAPARAHAQRSFQLVAKRKRIGRNPRVEFEIWVRKSGTPLGF
jgi:hypothetical protein